MAHRFLPSTKRSTFSVRGQRGTLRNKVAMPNRNNKARREVLLWISLLVISAVAALVVNVILERVNRPLTSPTDQMGGGVEVNVREMLLAVLHENLILCLG